MTEAFALQAPQRPMQLRCCFRMTCGPKSRSARVDSARGEALGQVEDDGDGEDVILARERDERLARLGLHVRRVDDRQLGRAASRLAATKCSVSNASSVDV